jgi:uncharacterized membrane protein YtjA (UPF0391 family)
MGPRRAVLQTYPAKSLGGRSRRISHPISFPISFLGRATISRPARAELSFPGAIGSASKARFRRANRCADLNTEVLIMLGWVVTFLIIALIAGILGFGGIAGASIEIAKVIFFIAVVLFLVSAIVGLARGRTRV